VWLRRGAIDANEPPAQVRSRFHGCMDASRLPGKVGVEGTDDNPGMARLLSMKPNEVLSVQRQDRPLVGDRQLEQVFIGGSLLGLAGFLDRHHLMSESAEFFHHGKWEVLVSL